MYSHMEAHMVSMSDAAKKIVIFISYAHKICVEGRPYWAPLAFNL